MSIAGGLPRAVERARAAHCDTLQVFTKSSGQWRARPLPDDEIAEFRRLSEELDVRPVIAHASYLINLAAPDDTLRRRSGAALGDELDRAEALGLLGVVLHPGSYTTTTEEEGLARIANGIAGVLAARPDQQTLLLLEHTAGQGTNLGYTFEQLGTIIAAVEQAGTATRLGVCLDTCHLLAAGHDLGDLARTPARHDADVKPLGREPAPVLGQPEAQMLGREAIPIEEKADLLHRFSKNLFFCLPNRATQTTVVWLNVSGHIQVPQ